MKKYIALLLSIIILSGCASKTSEDYYADENGYEVEIGNPYSDGSGHYAGYEWAEGTGGSCNGNSASFNEGCEEYYNQIE